MRFGNLMQMAAALFFAARLAAAQSEAPSQGPAAVLQPFVDRGVLAGAVTLTASADKILTHQAVGYQDVDGKIPMRADALFWIASQSKSMTAVAVMMLVDEGKVRLDDPVEKYLPEFKDLMVEAERGADHVLLKRPRHPITLRNVLSHTSGMRFSSPMERPTQDRLPLQDAVRSYALVPLLFEPDTKYQYSNAGINTAARILEVVCGTSYSEFIHSRLFDPLGMKDTTFWPDEDQLRRLAKSYKPNAAKDGLAETPIQYLTYPLSDRRRAVFPSGGYFSTAADVARFCRMMLRGGELDGKRYLSGEAVKEMSTRQTAPTLKDSYGLGFSVDKESFGHGGAYSTDMRIYPGRDLVTVFMVQHAGFPGNANTCKSAFRKAVER